jgi:GNAT superfamily N-acetyltransferase
VFPSTLATEAGLRYDIERQPSRARRRWWIAELDGELVGWGAGSFSVQGREGSAVVRVGVLPERRGTGLGTALAEAAVAYLRAAGAQRLGAYCDADSGVRFLEARGFVQTETARISVLATAIVDADELAGDVVARRAEGFELAPASAFADRPEELYAVDAAAARDVPAHEQLEVRLEDWLRYWAHPNLTREGSFAAVAGGRPVALTLLQVDVDAGRGLNATTGTLPEYRGRGLARLVKLAAASWAAEHGIATILTANHETNAPMLAVNERLGYRPVELQRSFTLELEG